MKSGSLHKLHLHRPRDDARPVGLVQQAAHRLPATRAVVQSPVIDIHPHEAVHALGAELSISSGLAEVTPELQALADASGDASEARSDEPYRRILFDGRPYHSPSEVYPHTVITYSYGKQLLAPGQRVGYLTFPPTMPGRERFRQDVFVAQFATGYAWPNALLQHALPDLEPLIIDIPAMERRRDRLVGALRDMGYEATMPEGTFYVMARSPIADDVAFTDILARHHVLVLPGSVVEVPGWFRISLTATDDMVEAGIPGFAAAFAEARSE